MVKISVGKGIENRKTIDKISETKNFFFGKFHTMNKALTRLASFRNDRSDNTADSRP